MNVFGLQGVGEIILVNCVAWLVIHLAAAWACSLPPWKRFNAHAFPYRHRRWEREGRFYQTVFRVRAWKSRLPDLGRFRKKRLASRSWEYLRQYVAESCRAELTHLIVILAVPLFIIWNNWLAAACMVPYVLLENLPCIIAQRYNRGKILRIIEPGRAGREANGRPALPS
jgi:glycosyl-4,4'-diaponeurosporenoate acyltransferase